MTADVLTPSSLDDVTQTLTVVRTRPKLGWLLVFPPALLAFAVTAAGAADRQLWADEYATFHAASLDFTALGHLIDQVDFVLAPYYVFMHGWIALFGDSEAALRAPSIAAMVVTSALLVLLGRRLVTTSAGVVAGCLFALLPSVSRYAHEARPYALAIMLAVLATLLLLRALESPTWPRWFLYGLVTILAAAFHIVAATILAAHFVMIWQSARATESLRPWRWLGPAIGVVCVIGPFGLTAAGQAGVIMWIKADQDAVLSLPQRLAGSVIAAAVIALFAAAGVSQLLHGTDRRALVLLLMWGAFPPLFTLATFEWLHLFLYRYLLFTLPAWVLLAGAGLDGIGRALVNRRKVLASAVLAAVVLAGFFWLVLPGQAIVRHDPVDGQPDFRAVAREITLHRQPGDGIAYGGTHDRGRRSMEYELRSAPLRDVFVEATGAQLGGFVARECAIPTRCLGDVQRIWVVNWAGGKDAFTGMPPLTVALLRERFAPGETKEFDGVRLLLLVRKDPSAPAGQQVR